VTGTPRGLRAGKELMKMPTTSWMIMKVPLVNPIRLLR
jgi:hypothetical protein